VDRPGHGWSGRGEDGAHDPRSQARILHRTIRHLGLHRPVLVGHSWGGAVALAYALEFPENTGGILFLAGLSHSWPDHVSRLYLAGARPILGRLLAWSLIAPGFELLAAPAIRWAFRPNRPPPRYQTAAGLPLYSRPSNFIANAEDVARVKPILQEMAVRYGEISAPMIALAGDKDGVVCTSLQTGRLVEKLPRAEVRLLEGVGHMPHHAAPKAVLAALSHKASIGQFSYISGQALNR
jgi:pimeloyl-ACP methyl ester carboxylesterase